MRIYLRMATASAIMLATTLANAAPLPQEQWTTFDFYTDIENGNWVTEALTPASFEFTLTTPAFLKVVDGGFAGDRFEVFANGASLGTTSVPDASATESYDLNFTAAFADPRWSKATFALNPGSYTITGKATEFVPDLLAGTGALMVTAVPEPQSYVFMFAGLALTMIALRLRAKSS